MSDGSGVMCLWKRVEMAKPPTVQMRIEVDGEGVVRVVGSTADVLTVTPEELGAILTALIKALVGPDDEAQEVNVLLN